MKEAVSIGIKLNFLQRLNINQFIIYSALDWKPFYILTAQSHITPPKFLPNTTFIYEVLKVIFSNIHFGFMLIRSMLTIMQHGPMKEN